MKQLTSFQKRVYTVVKQIPVGEVRSYAWVAKRIGKPKAVRAVGTALRKNRLPIIVPCHRVVRLDGDIGNYALGRDFIRLTWLDLSTTLFYGIIKVFLSNVNLLCKDKRFFLVTYGKN